MEEDRVAQVTAVILLQLSEDFQTTVSAPVYRDSGLLRGDSVASWITV